MPNRKICVVTGSRAEYGLLYSLLKDLQADTELDLQLVVTGMHLFIGYRQGFFGRFPEISGGYLSSRIRAEMPRKQ